MFRCFFQFPNKGTYPIFFFLAFFQVYSVVTRDSKVHSFEGSLFFVDYYKVWSFGRDSLIRVYVRIIEGFVHLILQDKFKVALISFVRIKFQFLALLPVQHLAHSSRVSLVLFLC